MLYELFCKKLTVIDFIISDKCSDFKSNFISTILSGTRLSTLTKKFSINVIKGIYTRHIK